MRTIANASLREPGMAVCALLLLAPLAGAFTLRSEVDARKVGVQDQVQLTITVEGAGAPDEIPLPALENLDVAGGPFSSSQMSIVNGRLSQSRSLTWVLQPRAPGKAEIGAVSAGGQQAPAIAIEVAAGSVRPRGPQRQGPFGRDPFFGRRGWERSPGRRGAAPPRSCSNPGFCRPPAGGP